jgi:hypothetical protein
MVVELQVVGGFAGASLRWYLALLLLLLLIEADGMNIDFSRPRSLSERYDFNPCRFFTLSKCSRVTPVVVGGFVALGLVEEGKEVCPGAISPPRRMVVELEVVNGVG